MPDAVKPPRYLTRRRLLRGLGVGLVGVVGAAVIDVLAGANFHTVIPGAVYRSSQPSAARLESIIKAYGIRTVVNFRGADDRARWYLDQCRVTSRYGVSEEDFNGSSASRLPSTGAMRDLLDIIDHADYPILFHCNRGIDRTGMASAVALLLKTDTTVAEARKQLGICYGHLSLGKTGNMDRFFDLYERWLAKRGESHSPESAPPLDATTSIAPDPAVPRSSPWTHRQSRADELPCGLRIRCTQHVGATVAVSSGNQRRNPCPLRHRRRHRQDVALGRSGEFEAVVEAGDSIVLTLALPTLKPGKYTLRVDMNDEQHAAFMQDGSEPLIMPAGGAVKKYLRIAGCLALAGFVAWRLDWGRFGAAFARLDLTLWLLGVGRLRRAQVVSSVRWRLLARALGFDGSTLRYVGYYFVGMFFNLALPTSVGGDVVRAWYLANCEERARAAGAAWRRF